MKVEIRKYKPTDAFLKVFIYGKPGVGKTTFGVTAPSPIYISAEGGLLSVAEKAPDFIEVKTMAELNAAYELLSNTSEHEYKTVIIDSLTEIQHVVMKRITGDHAPSREDWGVFSPEMARILRNFRDLPMHVVFLCLEDNDGKDDPYYVPQLYGKLAERACGFMDFVGRMAFYKVKDEGEDAPSSKRGICFTGSEKWVGKDRSGKLPSFVQPSFEEILHAVSKIKTGKQSVVREIEGDDTTEALKDREREDVRKEEPERQERPEPRNDGKDEKRPFATADDLHDLLNMIDDAKTEEDLDAVLKNYVSMFRYSQKQASELSHAGKEKRHAIRDGQTRMDVPLPTEEEMKKTYGHDEQTVREVDEVFGTGEPKHGPEVPIEDEQEARTPARKKAPPRRKEQPAKRKSTLEKLHSMKKKR